VPDSDEIDVLQLLGVFRNSLLSVCFKVRPFYFFARCCVVVACGLLIQFDTALLNLFSAAEFPSYSYSRMLNGLKSFSSALDSITGNFYLRLNG